MLIIEHHDSSIYYEECTMLLLNIHYITDWKSDEPLESAKICVTDFSAKHTPS